MAVEEKCDVGLGPSAKPTKAITTTITHIHIHPEIHACMNNNSVA